MTQFDTDTDSSASTVPISICDGNHNNNKHKNCWDNSHPFEWNEYNKQLSAVKKIALGTNAIYSLNWFLGFCSLTWATTVILGGVVTGLNKRDYCNVAILLLLEALRLACARFFCFSVRQHLIYSSAEPAHLVFNDCRNLAVAEIIRTLGQAVALLVVSVSIVIPLRSLRHVHYPSTDSSNFHSLETSLRVFYMITLVNAVIAAFGVFYARTVVYFHISPSSHSLHKYYDKIVWNGLDKGLFNSAIFDILKFSFQVQAQEYMHNQRALTVMYIYEYLMLYLYDHPHHKGFEAARVALDSDDVYVREAAANIVGCWVKLRNQDAKGIETLLLQEKLLAKLASALEHEETGRAASYSFKTLAENCPKEIAKVRSEAGDSLTDILIKRIHEVVRHKKYDKGLVFIKTLIHLLPYALNPKHRINGSDTADKHNSDNQQKVLLDCLINKLQVELAKDDKSKAEGIIRAYTELLSVINRELIVVKEHDQKLNPNSVTMMSVKIIALHNDLIKILTSSNPVALKRTKAVAAKALEIIWSTPEYASLQNPISNSKIIESLLQPPPDDLPKRHQSPRRVSLCSKLRSFLGSIILGLLVGPSPSAETRPRYEQHILKEEWSYVVDIVNIFIKTSKIDGNYSLYHDFVFLSPTELPSSWGNSVELRTVQDNYALPRWLENMKTTSCAIAATMFILMVVVVIYFTKYF